MGLQWINHLLIYSKYVRVFSVMFFFQETHRIWKMHLKEEQLHLGQSDLHFTTVFGRMMAGESIDYFSAAVTAMPSPTCVSVFNFYVTIFL